jgi:hypothetical protein
MQTPVVRQSPSWGQEPPPHNLTAGTYVTDGHNLFRCLSADRSLIPDATILLEDCMTLEVLILPMDEAAKAHLRVVREASPDDVEAVHPAGAALRPRS